MARKLLNTYLAMQRDSLPMWEAQTTPDRRYLDELFPLGHYGHYSQFESYTCIMQPPSWERRWLNCDHDGCQTPIGQNDRTLYTKCVKHFWTIFRVEWQTQD